MKIIFKKTCLVDLRTYDKDFILDLELSGDRKEKLVKEGVADWYVERPKPVIDRVEVADPKLKKGSH